MTLKTEEGLTQLYNCPNGMCRIVIRLKIDSNEVDGGRCNSGCGE